MKTNKLFSRRSFLRTCITYFLLCSLLVFAVSALSNTLVAVRLDRAFPTIDTLLQYEDALARDDFAAIPQKGGERLLFPRRNDNQNFPNPRLNQYGQGIV